MAWTGKSDRRTQLPPDWKTIRAKIIDAAGGRCQAIEEATGQRCTLAAVEVDHIGSPNDHRPGNLRALCSPHHAEHTSAQAAAARAQLRKKLTPPVGKHPGLK